jgi:hypothetical protein
VCSIAEVVVVLEVSATGVEEVVLTTHSLQVCASVVVVELVVSATGVEDVVVVLEVVSATGVVEEVHSSSHEQLDSVEESESGVLEVVVS